MYNTKKFALLSNYWNLKMHLYHRFFDRMHQNDDVRSCKVICLLYFLELNIYSKNRGFTFHLQTSWHDLFGIHLNWLTVPFVVTFTLTESTGPVSFTVCVIENCPSCIYSFSSTSGLHTWRFAGLTGDNRICVITSCKRTPCHHYVLLLVWNECKKSPVLSSFKDCSKPVPQNNCFQSLLIINHFCIFERNLLDF